MSEGELFGLVVGFGVLFFAVLVVVATLWEYR